MSYNIEEIKDKITIPEMLHNQGFDCPDKDDCMIKSPFRDERTGSFHIYNKGMRAKDFGGDFSGDVIDLYQELNGIDDSFDAIKAIAAMAGVAEDAPDILTAPKVKRRKRVAIPKPYVWSEEVEGIARDACHRLLQDQSGDMNALMVKKGWNFEIIKRLATEGILGVDKDGKILYIYPEGIKKRWDVHSSRGSSWLHGKSRDNLWRGTDLTDPRITEIYLTEGETDLISWLRFHDDMGGELSCSIPTTSWKPEPVMCHKVASYRSIYLMLDCDKAGFDATKRLAELFKQHATDCNVYALSWKKILKEFPKLDKPDLGEIKLNKLKEKIDNYFILV